MQTASAYPPETIIDRRYRILDTIARGSMGTVYRAQQLNLKREVALKVLDIDTRMVADGDREEHHRRFLYEAATLSRLTHPNTVRVYDFGIFNDLPFLVMEFVQGSSLQKLLKSGEVDPLRAVRIARQICDSLGEAHEQGLVHRDLKPANILIKQGRDGDRVKVVDFGLVKEMGDAVTMTGDGVLLGTPLYMSPEQIRGHRVDQRCDIYAIGVLLYQCLAGRPPFKEKQTAALLMAHLNDNPKPLGRNDLPQNLEWTVMRCLEKDREKRFFSVVELERALKICEAGLLKPELAGTMSLNLDRGHIRVESGEGRARFGWLKVILIPLIAAAMATVFAYVLVRGLGALRDSLTASPTEFVVQPATPLPQITPALPRPRPQPAPAPETADDASELPDPVVLPDPVGLEDPEPVAAPAPRPRPRPRTAPRAKPPPRPEPVVAVAPEPPLPQPVAETPEPSPTPVPQPSKLDIHGSDLKNPFQKR